MANFCIFIQFYVFTSANIRYVNNLTITSKYHYFTYTFQSWYLQFDGVQKTLSMPSKIVYLCIVLGYHLNITSTKKSPPKEQISIYKKRFILENNSLYKSDASRNRTGDTRPIIDTASPLLYQLSYGTNKHQLSQACLTIGNERIVRWCNITHLQSIRNESQI